MLLLLPLQLRGRNLLIAVRVHPLLIDHPSQPRQTLVMPLLL